MRVCVCVCVRLRVHLCAHVYVYMCVLCASAFQGKMDGLVGSALSDLPARPLVTRACVRVCVCVFFDLCAWAFQGKMDSLVRFARLPVFLVRVVAYALCAWAFHGKMDGGVRFAQAPLVRLYVRMCVFAL